MCVFFLNFVIVTCEISVCFNSWEKQRLYFKSFAHFFCFRVMLVGDLQLNSHYLIHGLKRLPLHTNSNIYYIEPVVYDPLAIFSISKKKKNTVTDAVVSRMVNVWLTVTKPQGIQCILFCVSTEGLIDTSVDMV